MSIERLSDQITIPYDEEALRSGDPRRIAEYILTLVKTLQEMIEQLVQVANLAIDLSDGDSMYLGLKNENGDYPDGTWRLKRVGDNLERQVKVNGIWKVAGIWERPTI